MTKIENLTIGTRTQDGEVASITRKGKLYFVEIVGHPGRSIAYGAGQFVV
jgi:hypothetical protein